MSTITAILPHPRRAGRFDVQVDGRSVGAMTLEALERLGLRVGVAFEPTRAAFEVELSRLATWDRATNMLALRARSRAELRRALLLKGGAAVQVHDVLERLELAGYLDDESFARQFARSKAVGGGMSKRRVQQELVRRGVSRDIAGRAVDEVFVEEAVDEFEAVLRAARKKLRTLERVDAPTRRRRLYGFLARKGFESEDVIRVMRELGVDGLEG
jgi:regulatory protein